LLFKNGTLRREFDAGDSEIRGFSVNVDRAGFFNDSSVGFIHIKTNNIARRKCEIPEVT